MDKPHANVGIPQGARRVGDWVGNAVDFIEGLSNRGPASKSIQTGLADLDAMAGGLPGGSLTVLAAPLDLDLAGLSLVMVDNIAMGKAGTAKAVGYFPLGTCATEFALHLISTKARITLADIREGAVSASRWTCIMEASEAIKAAPIFIDDEASLMDDPDRLCLRARAMMIQRCVEALFICSPWTFAYGPDEDKAEADKLARLLDGASELAQVFRIPVVLLLKTTCPRVRDGGLSPQDGWPEADLVTADADVVAVLQRTDKPSPDETGPAFSQPVELVVVKNSYGTLGTVHLQAYAGGCWYESEPSRGQDHP